MSWRRRWPVSAFDEPGGQRDRGDDRPGAFQQEEAPGLLARRDHREDAGAADVQDEVRDRVRVELPQLSRREGGEDEQRADDLDDVDDMHGVVRTVFAGPGTE